MQLKREMKGIARRLCAAAGTLLVLTGSGAEIVRAGEKAPKENRGRREAFYGEQWRPRIEVYKTNGVGELRVNDVAVIRFRQPRGGYSASERAQVAADHLRDALLIGGGTPAIRVDSVSDPDAPRVEAAGMVIATSPAATVPSGGSRRRRLRRQKVAQATALEQAEDWARALKRALALPGLTASDPTPLVPVGEARSIRLGGPARGAAHVYLAGSVEADASTVVKATTSGDIVRLTGLKPGHESLVIEREGAIRRVNVTVRPYAGTLDVAHPVTVTGPTALPSLIAKLVRVSAAQAVKPLPGASFSITSRSLDVSSPGPGKGATIAVPVRISGPDMLTVERKVYVPVSNTTLPSAPTSTLFYSNNPERVTRSATLFAARLPIAQQSTRLLYHHQNMSKQSLRFTAELVNDADTYVRVHVMGGDAGPERDTVWVGYRAASDYLKAQENHRGVVVEVPPHSRVPLSSLRFPNGLTISGLMQLRLMSGPAPLVRIAAENVPGTNVTLVPVPLPRDAAQLARVAPQDLSEHVYPNPAKRMSAEYSVGGPWTFIRFGKVPLKAVRTASTTNLSAAETLLYGNYGVFYDVAVKLKNPTDKPAQARVVFEPSAGMAGGIFLVSGGHKVEIPQTDMPRETTLTSVHLAPGETRTVNVRTLPLSGSNYPASIIVRP